MQQRTLQLFNEARATARSCGTERYPAAPALTWNSTLVIAAKRHSEDMATYNFFSHTGSDGSSVADRTTNAGYKWQTVGENLAAGFPTAARAVAGLLESPGHCRNIMNQDFTEMAVTCVEGIDTDFKSYWAQVLAAPK